MIGLEQGSLLWPFQPKFRYYLIDEQRLTADQLGDTSNLSTLLFRMEQSEGNQQLKEQVAMLIERTQGSEFRTIREAFVAWFQHALHISHETKVEPEQINTLMEVHDMLGEKIDRWLKEKEEQGLALGMQKGLEQGIEKGQREERRRLAERILQVKFGPNSERTARLADLNDQAIKTLIENAILAEDEASLFE